MAWSSGEPIAARLPGEILSAAGRDGQELEAPDGVEVTLTSSPTYYRLKS